MFYSQASAAIANRLGSNKSFDGSLSNFGLISNFINGLTKTDIEKIKAEESLQAVQQAFGSSKAKTIDNQMQSNTVIDKNFPKIINSPISNLLSALCIR